MLISENPGISRVNLAARTELSKTTVSALVDELIQEGRIVDEGAVESKRQGRRPNSLAVNDRRDCVIVLNWRKRTIQVSLVSAGFEVEILEETAPAEGEDPAVRIWSITKDFMDRHCGERHDTDQDALWEGVSRDSLAKERQQNVITKLHEMKAEHGLWRMAKRVLYFVLVIVGQYFLFRLTNWLFRKLKARILRLKDTKIKPVSIQGYELLDAQKQANLLVFLSSIGRYILMGLQLLFTVPLIFIIFPQTEGLAYQLLGYIWNPIRAIFVGIIDYIPKLFTIIVIWYAVRYLVRLVLYLAREVEAGRLKINGFYPDWAMPTFHIARFLLYAFMIAMIYPYLPGSDSGVFQGISVFVGLIVSLGSSTVIGNIIAGLVITYMRPFKMGDRIKLNDTTGDIIEKTPLVTRIRTPKNEVVTVPNSFIMSSHTVNYSTSAREYGLIIHSEVSIGYDVPWRQVNQILIDAALNTPGVVDDPRPFVLETSLSDWYPVYQINAYIKQADKMAQIYSDLHQNIQDKFNEAGIEIMSPHYMAVRDGNESTTPKEYQKSNNPSNKAGEESKPE